MAHGTCSVDDCTRPISSRGWCTKHYARWRNTGHPEGKFWIGWKLAKIDRRGPDDCWEWQGARTSTGYGSVGHDFRHMSAHVLAYEHWVGPVPSGLELDHLCRNRACCNPAHLRPIPRADNRRDVTPPQLRATCGKGHAFTPANTYYTSRSRQCRECKRILDRARRARLRAA